MISAQDRELLAERDQVIQERKAAFTRWANASEREKVRLNSEFVRPLNEQLLALNKRLGL